MCLKICRVRKHGHTVNLPFAVCQQKQHTANGWHTANLLFAMCQAKTHTAKVYICRVLHMEAHGKPLAHGKILAHGKLVQKKVDSALQIFSAIHVQCIVLLFKSGIFFVILAIFSYLISLVEFLGLNWKCFE